MLIEVKVKVSREISGKTRKRQETYVLDKEFFSEAEYTVYAILSEDTTITGFEIISLKRSSIKEIDEQTINNDIPSFMATLIDIFIQDDGTEKRLKYNMLLWANNLTEANNRANNISHQGYDMIVGGIKQVDYIYLQQTFEINQDNNQPN